MSGNCVAISAGLTDLYLLHHLNDAFILEVLFLGVCRMLEDRQDDIHHHVNTFCHVSFLLIKYMTIALV